MLRLHHGFKLSLFCAAALAVTACTQAGLAPKTQVQMESAMTGRDWDAVAARIADELRQRGMLVPPQAGAAPSSSPWGPYYVHAVTPGSAFLQSVSASLQSAIIAAGGTVARTPEGATVINLRVDFVRHGPREQAPGGAGTVAGAAYGMSSIAGSSAMANASTTMWPAAGAAAGAALATGFLADQFLLANPTMAAEATWQASISTSKQVLMQIGAPMYIASGDVPLYAGDVRLAEMTSPGAATNVAVRKMRYDP